MTKKLLGIAKYPIALLILYYVLKQADWQAICDHLEAISPVYLIAAVLSFTTAQCFSIVRMNAYYHFKNKPLTFGYSFRLYYVGMFYNVILPGGIGGDAYKVYLLKKRMDYPVGEGVRIQLATRTNGLLVLLITLYLSVPFMGLPIPLWIQLPLLALAALVTVTGYWWLSRRIFKDLAQMEWRVLHYSVGVQGFGLLCMVLLWKGLSGEGALIPYIFLFQLAAIAGMIPITIGGLGIRELTFFYGAQIITQLTGTSLDPELGVVISLLVFAITVASALFGLIWLGRMAKMSPCGDQPQ